MKTYNSTSLRQMQQMDGYSKLEKNLLIVIFLLVCFISFIQFGNIKVSSMVDTHIEHYQSQQVMLLSQKDNLT